MKASSIKRLFSFLVALLVPFFATVTPALAFTQTTTTQGSALTIHIRDIQPSDWAPSFNPADCYSMPGSSIVQYGIHYTLSGGAYGGWYDLGIENAGSTSVDATFDPQYLNQNATDLANLALITACVNSITGEEFNYGMSFNPDHYDLSSFSPNVAPVVSNIVTTTSSALVNSSVSVTGNFSDINTSDTHTAVWSWGDGSTQAGTLTESGGTGSVSGSHVYTTPGIYTVMLTVTDNKGASGSFQYQYISVYNPTSQGLFSASSKFTSPLAAYIANQSLTGEVKFGLSYKYKGGIANGDKQFAIDYKNANFTFNATSVSSLVISGNIAILQGTGTVNGVGTYNYFVTGDSNANTIRIQIKDASNNVVYDTQPGATLTAGPTTPVNGHVNAHN